MEDMELVTFCPECGPNVKVDEEGLCLGCGATAHGNALRRLAVDIHRIQREKRELTARAEKAEAERDNWRMMSAMAGTRAENAERREDALKAENAELREWQETAMPYLEDLLDMAKPLGYIPSNPEELRTLINGAK